MNISDVLDENHIIIDNTLTSKKGLFDLASQLLASNHQNIKAKDLLSALLDREKLGTTGIGFGIAIPHARIEKISHPQAVFIKLHNKIDFNSLDDQPVDLVFSFIVPAEDNETHLKIISSIVSTFKDETVRDKLRHMNDIKQLTHFLLNLENNYEPNQ